jgi:hypothetical protein
VTASFVARCPGAPARAFSAISSALPGDLDDALDEAGAQARRPALPLVPIDRQIARQGEADDLQIRGPNPAFNREILRHEFRQFRVERDLVLRGAFANDRRRLLHVEVFDQKGIPEGDALGEPRRNVPEIDEVFLAHPDDDASVRLDDLPQTVAKLAAILLDPEPGQQLLELIEDQHGCLLPRRLFSLRVLRLRVLRLLPRRLPLCPPALHLLGNGREHRLDVGRSCGGGLTQRDEAAGVRDHDDRMAFVLQRLDDRRLEKRALAGSAVAGHHGDLEIRVDDLADKLCAITTALWPRQEFAPQETPQAADCSSSAPRLFVLETSLPSHPAPAVWSRVDTKTATAIPMTVTATAMA